SLVGQGPAPGARATAFIDSPNRRLLLYVYNLPEPPPGRTYQLWVIVEGTPVSVGTFGVEPDGSTRFDAEPLPPFEGAVTVAVTVEPEGGVPQPTGPMVLMGS
ncbi:MAG: anti-sigma factor domain-containing protein, partial [Vicinamibacteria bacterium]